MKKHTFFIIAILTLLFFFGMNYVVQSRAHTLTHQYVMPDKDKKSKKKKENNENAPLSKEDSLRLQEEQLSASELLIKGLNYANGANGAETDFNKAIEYFQKAAEKGSKEAKAQLGLCYKNGQGVKKDLNKAATYFKQSAYAPDASAVGCLNYALFCEQGIAGVKKDLKEAKDLYVTAAQMGNVEAMYNLGYMYASAPNKSAKKEAFCWFYVAAQLGNAYAMTSLGNCYYTGDGVEQDYNKARICFEKASSQGDSWATYNLGIIYETGHGVPAPNLHEASKYYGKANQQGVTEAAQALARVRKALSEKQ